MKPGTYTDYERIVFNPDIPLEIKGFPELGIIEIKGKAVFRNAIEGENLIHFPVIEWIKKNFQNRKTVIWINFFLDAMNSVSAHPMLCLLKELDYIQRPLNLFEINWYYSKEDDDMLQAGKDYSEIINLPFNIVCSE